MTWAGGGAGVGSGGGFRNFDPIENNFTPAGEFGNVIIDNTGIRDFKGGIGEGGGHAANVGTGGTGTWQGVEMM